MNLLILGLNHNTAPLSLRERVAYGPEDLDTAIKSILLRLGSAEFGSIKEAAILSTCNRTEIYCAAENVELASTSLQNYLAQTKAINITELEEHLYTLTGEQAVKHAFRVASGLDSMVLGETQIVGQMKKAVKTAGLAGGLGLYLHYLFQKTFAVAKEVRSSTEIGAHSISMAAAAVRVANRIFGDLKNSSILFVGAGEMIELCAAHFCAQSPKKVSVANRTLARAQDLADSINGKPMKLSELPDSLHEYDIVVSCTASTLPIIGLGMVQRAIKQRRYKPLFMVDLAVPRDIETEVANLDEVYVYTVDDLGKVVQSGMEGRQAAVLVAEELIGRRIQEFHLWLLARNSVPHIKTLQERAEYLRNMELTKAKKALAKGQNPEEVLESMSQALMKKYNHDLLLTLRNSQSLSDEDYDKVVHLLDNFYLYHGQIP